MNRGMGKWEMAISSSSSTSDIIYVKPSGDYSADFLKKDEIDCYKLPKGQNKKQKKQKA